MEKAEEEVDERQETPPPPVVPLTPSYRIVSYVVSITVILFQRA